MVLTFWYQEPTTPFTGEFTGRIIDETKNLLVIETSKGIKRIPKMHSRFQLHLPGSELVEIDGSVMALAPEKRINLHDRKRIT